MKKNILIIIAFVVSSISYCQTWPKTYGEPDRMDFSYDICESYDKGYYILGGYDNSYFYPKYTWLIKTDINGNILWEKVLKCDGFVQSFALEPTIDGGLLISGAIIINSIGLNSHPLIVKLNSCGEKEWCKVFAESPNSYPVAIDVKETNNGDVVLLVNMYGENPEETMHLFKLNEFGEVLWKKPFCSGFDYAECAQPLGENILITSENKYLISGNVYWEDPWNPGGAKGIRPLFVLVDSLGTEEWVLPFGVNDTITGTAEQAIEVESGLFIGFGSFWYSQQLLDPLFISFSNNGDVLNYKVISSQFIDSTATKGNFDNVEVIDTLLVLQGLFGNNDLPDMYEVVTNQDLFDSTFEIFNLRKYTNYDYPYSISKSFDKKILSNATQKESDYWNISLSKLNLNLEFDSAYLGNYTYDSLCIPGPPQSGIISLDTCDIIVGIETPTPSEYYSHIKTIPISAYPNPAKDKVVFSMENTIHHQNISLSCLNLMGRELFNTSIITGQKEAHVNIKDWQAGMNMAIVYSNGIPVGQCKFVVQ